MLKSRSSNNFRGSTNKTMASGDTSASGMTVLELLLATTMLVVFTGVVALGLQFTLRFFSVAESGEQNEYEVSNGVLIDHQQIQMAMDDLVEVFFLGERSKSTSPRDGTTSSRSFRP